MLKIETVNDFKKLIYQSDDVVVDFYADWCGPCKMMKPVIEKVSKNLPDITFAMVDVDQLFEITQAYNIRSVPTIIRFKHGVVYTRESGYIPESKLMSLLTNQ